MVLRSAPSWRHRAGKAVAVALAITLGGPASPAQAAPGYTVSEPAIAVASPSVVYLEVIHSGYLRDARTGKLRYPKMITVQRRCSAVVVDPDGDAVTTTVCVQPTDAVVLVNALYEFAREQIAAGRLGADQADSFVAGIQATSAFTGSRPHGRPAAAIFGQFGIAVPGATATPAVPARVVAAQPATGGNAALIRVAGPDSPTISVDADADLKSGDSLVILGYGPGASQEVAGDYTIRAAAVTVAGATGTHRLGVSRDLGAAARGGAVVDGAGRLVALLDTDGTMPDEPSHDLITMPHIAGLLDQAGVTNRLSDADQLYREALAAYFAGHYSRAVDLFDALLREHPARAAAQTYRDRAAQRLAQEGNAVPNVAGWLGYGVALAIGILVIGLIKSGMTLAGRLAGARTAGGPADPEGTAGGHG